MSKYSLHSKGNTDDIRSSLKFIEEKATIDELKEEYMMEHKGQDRVTVLKMLNAAITRKMKKKN